MAIITTSPFDGPNPQLIDLASLAAAHGYAVDVLGLTHHPGTNDPSVRVINIAPDRDPYALGKHHGLVTITALLSALGNRSYDIVVSTDVHSLVAATCHASRAAFKHVYYCLELPYRRHAWWANIQYIVSKLLVPRADLVIVPNEHRRRYVAAVLRARSVGVIQNAPTIARGLSARAPAVGKVPLDAWRAKKYIVVYQGGLRRANYIREIAEASNLLSSDYAIVLCGRPVESEQPYFKECLALANNNVLYYLGHQTAEECATVRQHAQVALVFWADDSPNHFLCAPNKLYEALASGLAVVTSSNPPLVEIVEKYRVGACIPVTAQAVADAVRAVTGDSVGLLAMRERAYEAFLSDLNMDAQAFDVLEQIGRLN